MFFVTLFLVFLVDMSSTQNNEDVVLFSLFVFRVLLLRSSRRKRTYELVTNILSQEFLALSFFSGTKSGKIPQQDNQSKCSLVFLFFFML
jgi:uncharacterized membrane protein